MNEERSRLLLILYSGISLVCAHNSDVDFYINEWVVHVPYGVTVAREVARNNDMEFIGPDHGNDGYYRMVKKGIPLKSSKHREDITNQLNNDRLITVAIQDAVNAISYRGSMVSKHSEVEQLYSPKNNYTGLFNDEFWDKMWYLQDFRTNMNEPVMNMNVLPVFLILGITGEGVNITITDDGFETSHPEMENKFKPELSWNYISNNTNILPDKDEHGNFMSHGTKCAGIIIMQPNNTLCGVGVAYGANIGGIKFLDSKATDTRKAKVLEHAIDYVSIYSNSWGPPDTGEYMKLFSDLVKKSFERGISRGRDGKGAIYVFAAGNGKYLGDNCACDDYVNSIYSVVVAACDDRGRVTQYSERCAAILTTAYSGAGLKKNIVTTDVNKKCTEKFAGTSAAAPLVSGIIALGLSANPTLSWRDVQHLIAWTSQIAPLSDNDGWNLNAAGFYYSVDFGFGLMNAYLFVQEAQTWINVPEMSSCDMHFPEFKGHLVSRNSSVRIEIISDGCEGLAGEINFLEYVQLVLTVSYPKRGDIQISMRSPSGTECSVLESRPKDFNKEGLSEWIFKILAFWGESPHGDFIIDIFDTTGPVSNEGFISKIALNLHGTKDPPDVYRYGSRSYDKFVLPKSSGIEDNWLNFIRNRSLQKIQPKFAQPVSNEVESHDVQETQDAEPLIDEYPGSQVKYDDKTRRFQYVQMQDNFVQNVLTQHDKTSRKNDAQNVFKSNIEKKKN